MSKRHKLHSATVAITHLSQDAEGCASVELTTTRKSIVVPYTLPGEVVDIDFVNRKRKKLSARLIVVKQPSPQRIDAACAHFGACGGCKLQHMSYEDALAYKQDRVHELFHEWKESAHLYPAIASKKIWEYRNKMEFSFSQDKAGERYLGLILAGSRGKVLNIDQCLIAPKWMTQALQLCRDFWQKSGLAAYNYHSNTGHLRTLTLRHSPITMDRMCILTVSGNADYAIQAETLREFVRCMSALDPSKDEGKGKLAVILRIHQIAKGVKTEIYEMKLLGDDFIREEIEVLDNKLEFHISPLAFFQPNTEMASEIYERALSLAKLTAEDVVYDLYCGIGSFGLSCAHLVKHVVGIELSHDSAYDARVNAQRFGINNYTILRGDVGTVLKEHKELPKPDCILLDPPRSGLDDKAMEEVLQLQPKKIVYVSCNPATQAENVKSLTLSGYELQAIQPIDQFPHTPHIENIAILLRITV